MSELNDLRFFDCSTFIGQPTKRSAWRPVTASELVAEMDRAGIGRALVWHIAQYDVFPLLGNDLLDEAIAQHRERLVPCWSALPTQCGEVGDLEAWLGRAGAAGVKALRLWPRRGRFPLRREVVGDILTRMIERRIPLVYSMLPGEDTWQELYDLLESFPDLCVIVNYQNCWSADRSFRPLIESYPHAYVEISAYFPPGGIEAFVESYGSARMLFGSGFPVAYHGAMMLMLGHAEIALEDKQAIAAGNLERLLEEVDL